MDYADPDGQKIDIAVSRIPGEKPAGPPRSPAADPRRARRDQHRQPLGKGQKLPQDVRDAYDLIGFDAARASAPPRPSSCGLEHGDLARIASCAPGPARTVPSRENMAAARRMSDACARNGGELHPAHQHRQRGPRPRPHPGRARRAEDLRVGRLVRDVRRRRLQPAVPAPHRPRRAGQQRRPRPRQVGRAWLAAYEAGVEDTFPEFAEWAAAPGNPDRLGRHGGRGAPAVPAPRRRSSTASRSPGPAPTPRS